MPFLQVNKTTRYSQGSQPHVVSVLKCQHPTAITCSALSGYRHTIILKTAGVVSDVSAFHLFFYCTVAGAFRPCHEVAEEERLNLHLQRRLSHLGTVAHTEDVTPLCITSGLMSYGLSKQKLPAKLLAIWKLRVYVKQSRL